MFTLSLATLGYSKGNLIAGINGRGHGGFATPEEHPVTGDNTANIPASNEIESTGIGCGRGNACIWYGQSIISCYPQTKLARWKLAEVSPAIKLVKPPYLLFK